MAKIKICTLLASSMQSKNLPWGLRLAHFQLSFLPSSQSHFFLSFEAVQCSTQTDLLMSWKTKQSSAIAFAWLNLIISLGCSLNSLFRCAFCGRNISTWRVGRSGQEWASASRAPGSPSQRGAWKGERPSSSDDGQLCEYLFLFTGRHAASYNCDPRVSARSRGAE